MTNTNYMVISILIMAIFLFIFNQITTNPSLHWLTGWLMCVAWILGKNHFVEEDDNE
jgi:Ca2+/Na+ antiporter